MTKDKIIHLAVECQLVTKGNSGGVYIDALVLFAELVAAHEREACAEVCEQSAEKIRESHPEYVNQVGKKICENLAAAIRFRGGK